jgi:nucleoside phosphorylase
MILLLCATDQEFAALEKRLEQTEVLQEAAILGWSLKRGLLPSGDHVLYAQTGMGKINAAAATAALLPVADDIQALTGVIHFGVAGGAQAAPGETIIANTLVCHDYGLRVAYDRVIPCTPGDLPSTDAIPQGIALQENSKAILKWVAGLSENTKIRMGVVATGDQFIQDVPSAEAIVADFGADVLDMESYAVGHVLVRLCNNLPWLVVRTASDEADFAARDEYLDNADNASEQAVAVVLQLVDDWPAIFEEDLMA